MPEPRGAYLRAFVHPALAVSVPFAFLQAIDAMARIGAFAGIRIAPPGSLLVVLLIGVSEAVAANVLGRERISGALPRLRELVVSLAACGLILWLLDGGPFRGDYNPLQPVLAWPLILCTAQWFLTLYVQGALRARERFIGIVSGKRGNALVAAAHDAGGEAGSSHIGLEKLRTSAVVLQGFTIVPYMMLLSILKLIGAPGPAFAVTARVFLNALVGVMFIVVVRGFLDEQICRAAGAAQEDAPASRRFGGPLTGVAVLFLAGLGIAGGGALLPLSLLARLIDWINSLYIRALGHMLVRAPVEPPPVNQGQLAPPIPELPNAPGSPLLAEILRIAGIVIIVAAAAGFLSFIVRPLLRRRLFTSARRFHPLRATAAWLGRAWGLLAGLPLRIIRWLRAPGKGIGAIPRAILAGLRESAAAGAGRARATDRARRASQARAVREFLRLARWGARAGVPLAGADAPMEYALRLIPSAPEKEDSLREAARVFEGLAYSADPDPHGVRALARVVDGIVR